MSLTFGHGPFGRQPGGEFNFTRQGPDAVLYWEDFPKRVRAEFNGKTVINSRRVKALHETGKFMVFYFRRQDVDMEQLEPSAHRTDVITGFFCFYPTKVEVEANGERLVE